MKLSSSTTQIRFGVYGAILAMFFVVLALSAESQLMLVTGWAAVAILALVAVYFIASGVRKFFHRLDGQITSSHRMSGFWRRS